MRANREYGFSDKISVSIYVYNHVKRRPEGPASMCSEGVTVSRGSALQAKTEKSQRVQRHKHRSASVGKDGDPQPRDTKHRCDQENGL